MDQIPAQQSQEREDSAQSSQPVPIDQNQVPEAQPEEVLATPEPLPEDVQVTPESQPEDVQAAPEVPPPAKPKRPRWPWIVGGVVLFLILAGVGAVFAINAI